MYASIQLHCLDSHTKKSRFSSTHSHALLPVRQGHSVLRYCSARDKRGWEWSLFWGLCRLIFSCCQATACACCLPFAKACARFQGCICLVLYFWIGLARGGRERLYDVLFFSCTFFTWHASLWRSGLSMNLTLPIKKLRSSFLRLIRDREYLCAGKGSFFIRSKVALCVELYL